MPRQLEQEMRIHFLCHLTLAEFILDPGLFTEQGT